MVWPSYPPLACIPFRGGGISSGDDRNHLDPVYSMKLKSQDIAGHLSFFPPGLAYLFVVWGISSGGDGDTYPMKLK